MKYLLISMMLFSANIAFAQLPTCEENGNEPSEISFDKKSNKVVFFDQSNDRDNKNKFQVWDLKKQKMVTVGELPDSHNLILGFADSKTIVFARYRDANGYHLTFGPIRYYNTDTHKIREVAVEREDINLIAYNLKAGVAIVKTEGGLGTPTVDLKTGKVSSSVYDLQFGSDGFSQNGSDFYTPIWFHYDREMTVFNWSTPAFFEVEPRAVSSIKIEELGLSHDTQSRMYSSSKALSESGKSLAIALETSSDRPSSEKEVRKIMWLDIPTGQKTFCELDLHKARTKTQIVDEKERLVLFQNDLYPNVHLRTLVDMKTCTATPLPKMDGVAEDIAGHFISMGTQRLYYSRGAVWDLDSGKSVLRSCQ